MWTVSYNGQNHYTWVNLQSKLLREVVVFYILLIFGGQWQSNMFLYAYTGTNISVRCMKNQNWPVVIKHTRTSEWEKPYLFIFLDDIYVCKIFSQPGHLLVFMSYIALWCLNEVWNCIMARSMLLGKKLSNHRISLKNQMRL